jgi:hypothetical protein
MPRFRFSLRSLLVAAAIAAPLLALGWLALERWLQERKPPFEWQPQMTLTLEADAKGNLTNINFAGKDWGTYWQGVQDELVRLVGEETGPNSRRAKTEIEIDAPIELKYVHIVQGLNYLTGIKGGGAFTKLVNNVKFRPRTKAALKQANLQSITD